MFLKKDSKTNQSDEDPGYFDSEHKNLIRSNWNQPLIKFLSKKTNSKLIYIGLPSREAKDILQWLDYIKSVIAFQCRDYKNSSDPSQTREEIIALEGLLRDLERQRKIDDFVVFDGFLEEVILREFDNSPSQIEFAQNSVITLYNLDFCNKITSPMKYVDRNGDVQTAYKFNAIQKLLHLQNSLSKISDRFIFFLTVHSSYDGKEIHDFVNTPPNSVISEYLKKYNKLQGDEKNARIVRLFTVYQIQTYFVAHNFTPKFLPVVKYNGLRNAQLLHFVVMGVKSVPTASGVANHQSFEDIMDLKFATIEKNNFVNSQSEIDEKNITILDPLSFFTNSRTYKKLWE